MALARTLINTYDFSDAVNTGHGGNCDLGTVVTGDLIVLYAAALSGADSGSNNVMSAPTTASGTATVGTYTRRAYVDTSSAWWAINEIYTVPVTAGGTLVIDWQDAYNTYGIWIIAERWTGHDPDAPIGGTISGLYTDQASGNPNPATSTITAPATGDYVILFANAWSDSGSGKGWTPGADFTEIMEIGGATNDQVEANISSRTGSTSTTVTWPTNTAGGPTRYAVACCAITIVAGEETAVDRPRWVRDQSGLISPRHPVVDRSYAW